MRGMRARVLTWAFVGLSAATADAQAVPDSVIEEGDSLEADEDLPVFSATARSTRIAPDVVTLDAQRLRDQPGSLGDPIRAIDITPGIVPVASGVPFYYVRGAPPAGTLYVYDGITLPALFHLGLGPSVIHPRMLGELRLHTGAAPARFGRYIGAVIEIDPASRDIRAPHGEVELRALDLNGYVEAPVGGGSLQGAIRLGWPALFIGEVIPGGELFYGDYQVRAALPLSDQDRFELVLLGSADRLAFTLPDGVRSTTEVMFQRAEMRIVHALEEGEIGLALRGGYDHSVVIGTSTTGDVDNPLAIAIDAASFGFRGWGRFHEGIVRGHVGLDVNGSIGRPDARLQTVPGFPLRADSLFANSASRSVAGAFVDLDFQLHPDWKLHTGLRFDQWMVGHAVQGALDPRVSLDWRVLPELEWHVAVGVSRQPLVFYLPFPGLSEVPIQQGLQTAMQAELGARLQVGILDALAQVYVQRYEGIALADAFLLADASNAICARPLGDCVPVGIRPTTNGFSYGAEMMLQLAATEPLSGTLSYTLAWNDLEPVLGLPYRSSYDIRHILQLAMLWNPGGGFTAGVRAFVRSGAAQGIFFVSGASTLGRYTRELDAYYRLDASVAYAWDAGWSRLRLSLEWVNLTMSQEPFGLDCPQPGAGIPSDATCSQVLGPAIFIPNLGMRVSL